MMKLRHQMCRIRTPQICEWMSSNIKQALVPCQLDPAPRHFFFCLNELDARHLEGGDDAPERPGLRRNKPKFKIRNGLACHLSAPRQFLLGPAQHSSRAFTKFRCQIHSSARQRERLKLHYVKHVSLVCDKAHSLRRNMRTVFSAPAALRRLFRYVRPLHSALHLARALQPPWNPCANSAV